MLLRICMLLFSATPGAYGIYVAPWKPRLVREPHEALTVCHRLALPARKTVKVLALFRALAQASARASRASNDYRSAGVPRSHSAVQMGSCL
jgi:hypothetical protein